MSQADRLADLTLELCRIPSVCGDERALADHVEAWARARLPGRPILRVGDSLVVGAPDGRRPCLALVGHLDTVPPSPGEPPPERTPGRVRALGASDMKSGLAVMQALAEDLDLDALPYNVLLVFYAREEGPMEESGLKDLLASPEAGLDRVDLAVILEPTDGVVQVGCVGSLHATVTFTGKAAHSARPWLGENAVTQAGTLLAALHARAPVEVERGGQRFREVMTVTRAEGGRYRNVVPDRFELNLNYRFAPGRSVAEAQAEVERLVGAQAEVTWTDLAPSGDVPADSPHYRRLLEVTGLGVAPKQAWTDVARFSAAGIAAVNYGPGLTAQAHQLGEYCEVDDLVACHAALRRFLETGPK